LCSQPIDSTLRRNNRMGASIDHLVPISRGGADQPTNVAAAHLTCNQRRNNRPLS
jgi:5-methylcytosine-specific restriction endonuclease McrA